MTEVATKQPGETLAYTFDFTDRIGDTGVALSSITTLTATAYGLVSGAGVVSKSGQAIDGQGVNVMLSGGTADEDYVLLCVVVGDNGETYELDGVLRIIDARAASELVVEDGSSVVGANSYVSIAEANAYLRSMSRATDWDALDNDTKAGRLIHASAYLDANVRWRGMVMAAHQTLGWPRYGVTDREGRPLDADIVPTAVQNATIEIASVGEIAVTRSRTTTAEKIGPIDVTYAAGANVEESAGRYSYAMALVRDLAAYGPTGVMRVVRA